MQPGLTPKKETPAVQPSSGEGEQMGTFWTYVLDFFGLAGLVQPATGARAAGAAPPPVAPVSRRDSLGDGE
ncbi:MAG TPA: hypothetical protein VK689_02095 [Armatimonadota bacterium]|nr:hypothetical protein [Armatimonadota bacterium]